MKYLFGIIFMFCFLTESCVTCDKTTATYRAKNMNTGEKVVAQDEVTNTDLVRRVGDTVYVKLFSKNIYYIPEKTEKWWGGTTWVIDSVYQACPNF